MFAHKIVTANRAALRLPADALRDLKAEALKWQSVWQQGSPLDMDELLLPLGLTQEVSSQEDAWYVVEGGGFVG